MDDATNSQDLDLDNLDAPEFDALVPDLDEMQALEGIDIEALAAEETVDLGLDMMDLEPSMSTAEPAEIEVESNPTGAAVEESVSEPVKADAETASETPAEIASEELVEASEPETVNAPTAVAAADEKPSASDALAASSEESDSKGSDTKAADSTETDPTAAAKSNERISHIVFRIDEKRYAVEMQRLLELDRMTPVTPVPHTPEFILGVTNLRGEIVSVIDLRRLLGMPALDRPETGRLLKLRDRRELVVSGVLVDAIQGARTIKPEQIRPASRNLGPKVVPLLQGVCDDGGEEVNVLDVDKLFESEQVRALTGA